MQPVGSLWHKRDTGQVGKGLTIAEGNGTSLVNTKGEDLKLAATDAREHVAHAVVVAELGGLVGDAWVAGLLGPEARPVNPVLVPGDEHAAAGGGDDLVSVEGVVPDVAERPGRLSLVERANRFGGVLDHDDSVFGAGMEDGVHIGALAIEVDRHQRLGEPVRRRPLSQGVGQDIGIQVPGCAAAIHKDRHATLVDNGVGGRNEGEGGTEHFVAGTDSHHAQRKVQRSGSADQGDGGEPDACRKFLLEGGEAWPNGGEPICRKGFADVDLFSAAHVGDREQDAFHWRAFTCSNLKKFSRGRPGSIPDSVATARFAWQRTCYGRGPSAHTRGRSKRESQSRREHCHWEQTTACTGKCRRLGRSLLPGRTLLFFFNEPETTEIYPLSQPAALPI